MVVNQVNLEMLQAVILNAVKKAHAPGEVVMFFDETNPIEKYGGNWERTAQGQFPLGAGGGYVLGDDGGNDTHAHGAGGLYAKAIIQAAGYLDIDYSVVPPYTTNYRLTATSGNAQTGTEREGINVAGTTASASNMPPYIVFNIWKKISD